MQGLPLLAIIAIIIESIGIILIGSGITIEIKRRARRGYLLITLGSCLIAVGALLWAKVL